MLYSELLQFVLKVKGTHIRYYEKVLTMQDRVVYTRQRKKDTREQVMNDSKVEFLNRKYIGYHVWIKCLPVFHPACMVKNARCCHLKKKKT